VFDNDMDFDDTAALAYLARLHKAGEIDLRLVSITSAGAGLPGRAIRHARCLMERLGIGDVPVADSTTPGVNPFPDLLRFTIDFVLFDLTSTCTASTAHSEVPAERAIINAIEASHDKVTLLITGPATNVAGALALAGDEARDLAVRVKHVSMEGGAIGVPGGLCCGLDTIFDDTATFNPWADPPAAQALLDNFQHVTFVGENATVNVPIRPTFVARLQTEGETPEARWVAALGSHPVIKAAIAAGLPAFWWDPLMTVATIEDGQAEFDNQWISIVQSGPSSGRTLEVNPSRGSQIQFAVEADGAAFEDAFLAGLNTPLP
jgi:purine nucleosidase